MTNNDIAAGQDALESYVKGIEGWFKYAVIKAQAPNAFHEGAIDTIKAADASQDQSPAGRQAAARLALRRAINATGHGADVTDQQIHDGTAVTLAAVNKARHVAPTGKA